MALVKPLKIVSGEIKRIPITDSVRLVALGLGADPGSDALLSLAPGAGNKAIIAKAASGQTANILEIQNNAGGLLAGFEPDGDLNMGSNDIVSVNLVDGVDISAHNARHGSTGADEMDGDVLDIDYVPTNYTRITTPPQVTTQVELTAHLGGIDDKIGFLLAGGGGTQHAKIYSGATVSTSSSSYVDAFAGSSVTPPSDGAYLIIFEAETTGTSGNTEVESAFGKNSTTSTLAESERLSDPAGANKVNTITITKVETGLTTSDTIHGIFRKSNGGGSAKLLRRHLTIIKVS
jgi:hypothetical protein